MNSNLQFTFISFHVLVVLVVSSGLVLACWPRFWFPMLAAFLGALTAFIDQHSREAQLPALLLLAGGLFLGTARPRHAWRWALALSVWVPAENLLRGLMPFGVKTGPQILSSCLALVPALIGAYSGVLVAWIGSRRNPTVSSNASTLG